MHAAKPRQCPHPARAISRRASTPEGGQARGGGVSGDATRPAGADTSRAITCSWAGALAPTVDWTSTAGALHELIAAQSPSDMWSQDDGAAGASPQSWCGVDVSITMLTPVWADESGVSWDAQRPWSTRSRVSDAPRSRPVNRRSMDTCHRTLKAGRVAVGTPTLDCEGKPDRTSRPAYCTRLTRRWRAV